MNAVKLKYLGNTDPFVLAMPQLSREYTFSKDTGMESVVEYGDAKYLLAAAPRSFKVSSGIMYVIPEDVASDPTPDEDEPALQPGEDGVEGVDPIVEPVPEPVPFPKNDKNPPTAKTGKKGKR
jgi:hypothetical protein